MDWPALIDDLLATKMTQAQIAAECRGTQSMVSALLNRKAVNPSFNFGYALVRLHEKRCGKARTRRQVAEPARAEH